MKRTVLALLAFAAVLVAQGGPQMGPGPMGFGPMAMGPEGNPPADGVKAPMEALKEATGLTDEQITQLRELRQQLREQLKTHHEEAAQLQKQLRAAVGDSSVTDEAVGKLVRSLEQNRTRVREIVDAQDAKAVQLMKGWGLGSKLEELQAAAKLVPAIGQARALGLIEPPEKAAGIGAAARARAAGRAAAWGRRR